MKRTNQGLAHVAPVAGTPTLAQVLAAGNIAGAKIASLTNPTLAQDAATKAYTDAGDTAAIAAAAAAAATLVAGGVGLIEDIEFLIDGGGAAITAGIKGDLIVDFNCTIQRATLLADQSGSIIVNIWKDTYANYPPVVGDKITASAPPTIAAATKSQDSTLTGWTTAIIAGDTLRFNVDALATSITRVTLILKVTRT